MITISPPLGNLAHNNRKGYRVVVTHNLRSVVTAMESSVEELKGLIRNMSQEFTGRQAVNICLDMEEIMEDHKNKV
jgi:hypothetical protein